MYACIYIYIYIHIYIYIYYVDICMINISTITITSITSITTIIISLSVVGGAAHELPCSKLNHIIANKLLYIICTNTHNRENSTLNG